MPKYLVEVKYTLEGIKGVKAEGGSARVAAAKAAIEEQGGKVEAFYFAFGHNDAYVLVDMPDNVSAAAVGLIVSAGGRGHDAHRRAPHRGRDGRRGEAQDALPGAGGLRPRPRRAAVQRATTAPLQGPRVSAPSMLDPSSVCSVPTVTVPRTPSKVAGTSDMLRSTAVPSPRV